MHECVCLIYLFCFLGKRLRWFCDAAQPAAQEVSEERVWLYPHGGRWEMAIRCSTLSSFSQRMQLKMLTSNMSFLKFFRHFSDTGAVKTPPTPVCSCCSCLAKQTPPKKMQLNYRVAPSSPFMFPKCSLLFISNWSLFDFLSMHYIAHCRNTHSPQVKVPLVVAHWCRACKHCLIHQHICSCLLWFIDSHFCTWIKSKVVFTQKHSNPVSSSWGSANHHTSAPSQPSQVSCVLWKSLPSWGYATKALLQILSNTPGDETWRVQSVQFKG